jgi:hypothetical protein
MNLEDPKTIEIFLNTPEVYGYEILESGGFHAIWILKKENSIYKVVDVTDGGWAFSQMVLSLGQDKPKCLPDVRACSLLNQTTGLIEMEVLTHVPYKEHIMDSLWEAWAGENTNLEQDITSFMKVLNKNVGHIIKLDLVPGSLMQRNEKLVIVDIFESLSHEALKDFMKSLPHIATSLYTERHV